MAKHPYIPPRTSAVLVIGVSGGSGSGKSTFGRMLQANLGDAFCGFLAQDSYYRDLHEFFDKDGGTEHPWGREGLSEHPWGREGLSERPWGRAGESVNFDHPESIEFGLLIRHLQRLKQGEDIEVPQYDFITHRRRPSTTFFPCRPVIILDGILLLTQSELRPLLDFAFFIDTQEDLRFTRRLARDVRERGRTPEGVREQFFKQVKPMHDLFVEPSRRFADRVISGEKSFGPVIDEIVFGLKNPSPFIAPA